MSTKEVAEGFYDFNYNLWHLKAFYYPSRKFWLTLYSIGEGEGEARDFDGTNES